MDDIDAPPIVTLDIDDASAALALSAEAHWNQTEADWKLFLSQGVVFGARDRGGLIATAALLPYSNGQAWISMVLVTGIWQRRGIATRLVKACLDAAQARQLTAWLDATPAGAMVYGPLGFTPTAELRRLRLIAPADAQNDHALAPGNLDDFIARDAQANGFGRDALLRAFGARAGSRLVKQGEAIALVRDGRVARHIGPLLAYDWRGALALVQAIAANETRPLIMDVVRSHHELLTGLTNAGWVSERPLQRMRLGQPPGGSIQLPFAVAGPEFG